MAVVVEAVAVRAAVMVVAVRAAAGATVRAVAVMAAAARAKDEQEACSFPVRQALSSTSAATRRRTAPMFAAPSSFKLPLPCNTEMLGFFVHASNTLTVSYQSDTRIS